MNEEVKTCAHLMHLPSGKCIGCGEQHQPLPDYKHGDDEKFVREHLEEAHPDAPASCSPDVEELRRLILGRIGAEFDGECHLTESEALQIADALESMMREKDAMGWQPIETAPRDGTHILAAIAGETFGYQQPVLATVVHWFNDPEEPGFYTSVNERAPERTFEATHWMPLPAPPRAALDMTLDKGSKDEPQS